MRTGDESDFNKTCEEGFLEDLIDLTVEDSFPASDPPFWTTGCRAEILSVSGDDD